jgi:hypothetical protein
MAAVASGFVIASILLAGGAGFYGWSQHQRATVLQAQVDAENSKRVVALFSRDQCLADVTAANAATEQIVRDQAAAMGASANLMTSLHATALQQQVGLSDRLAMAISSSGSAGQACPAVEAVLDTYRQSLAERAL